MDTTTTQTGTPPLHAAVPRRPRLSRSDATRSMAGATSPVWLRAAVAGLLKTHSTTSCFAKASWQPRRPRCVKGFLACVSPADCRQQRHASQQEWEKAAWVPLRLLRCGLALGPQPIAFCCVPSCWFSDRNFLFWVRFSTNCSPTLLILKTASKNRISNAFNRRRAPPSKASKQGTHGSMPPRRPLPRSLTGEQQQGGATKRPPPQPLKLKEKKISWSTRRRARCQSRRGQAGACS